MTDPRVSTKPTKICEKHGLPIDITTVFHQDNIVIHACWACIREFEDEKGRRTERLLWQLLDKIQQEKIRRLKDASSNNQSGVPI